MRRKRSNSFFKMGMLCTTLLMALGVMGVSYSLWSDVLDIEGGMFTYTFDVQLSEGTPSAGVSATISGHTLEITVNADAAGTYTYTDFDIHNAGSVPVKIQAIDITQTWASVGGVGVGDPIEQNGVAGDTVYGAVTMDIPEAGIYNVDITFTFLLWNQ